MILHRICVENWRSLQSRVCLDDLSPRLNIVFGPNGTGKSSLFEALRWALFAHHTIQGRDACEIRPWGTSLGPRVEVEFEHDGQRYRVEKQFLQESKSRFFIWRDGGFFLQAEGRAADEKIRGLFSNEKPGRGLFHAEHMGLLQVLFAPQGNMELSGLSASVTSMVRSALGVRSVGQDSGPVLREIERRYGLFFTPKGTLSKPSELGGRILTSRQRLAELRADHQRIEEDIRRLEAIQSRLGGLVSELHLLDMQVPELRKHLDEMRVRALRYESLKSKVEEEERRADTARQRHEEVQALSRQIEELQREMSAAAQRTQEFENQLAEVGEEVEKAEARLLEARRDAAQVEEERRFVVEKRELEALARKHAALVAVRDREQRRLAAVEEAADRVAHLKEQRALIVAPDPREIKTLRRLLAKRTRLGAKLDAALIHLEIEALGSDLADVVDVLEGERPGPLSFDESKRLDIRGDGHVLVELQGVARIRARGPVGDLGGLREELAALDREIEDRTRPYGTSDIAELEDRAARAKDVASALSAAEQRVTELLGEDDGIEALRAAVASLDAELDAIWSESPDWRHHAPDPLALAEELEKDRARFEEKRQRVVGLVSEGEAELSRLQERRKGLAARLADERGRLERTRSRLESLEAQGKTLEKLAGQLSELAMAWDAAKERLARAQRELDEMDADPAAGLDAMEKELEALEARRQAHRELVARTEGELRDLANRGSKSLLVAKEEEIAKLEREVAGLELRSRAVALLRDTYAQVRAEASAGIVEPLEKAAVQMWRRISGPSKGKPRLGEGLVPVGFEPASSSELVGLENLSGGEYEQVQLVAHLALAEVLARGQRQMILLDDVLTATDRARFSVILHLLDELSDRLQIVMMTCNDERYGMWKQARRFDLEDLVGRK